MTQEDFKARVSMAYEGREQWDAFLDRLWLIHTSELPRWISVEDELPRWHEWVIVYTPHDVPSYFIDRFEGFTEYWKLIGVKYWARLPLPPQQIAAASNIMATEKKSRKEVSNDKVNH